MDGGRGRECADDGNGNSWLPAVANTYSQSGNRYRMQQEVIFKLTVLLPQGYKSRICSNGIESKIIDLDYISNPRISPRNLAPNEEEEENKREGETHQSARFADHSEITY